MSKKLKLDKAKALENLKKYTDQMATQNGGEDKDYAALQYSWNKDILERSMDYIPKEAHKLIGIGSFQGALELALAPFFDQVFCVDHESFLPAKTPKNVTFHQADIDSAHWRLPDDQAMFDVAYCIETIEHLLWSPLPLLKWMQSYSHISVISTPDDAEWPAMNIRPWTRFQKFIDIPRAKRRFKGNPEPMFHTKQYGQAEFIEMLDFVGFRVLEFFRTGEGHHQMVAIVQPRHK